MPSMKDRGVGSGWIRSTSSAVPTGTGEGDALGKISGERGKKEVVKMIPSIGLNIVDAYCSRCKRRKAFSKARSRPYPFRKTRSVSIHWWQLARHGHTGIEHGGREKDDSLVAG